MTFYRDHSVLDTRIVASLGSGPRQAGQIRTMVGEDPARSTLNRRLVQLEQQGRIKRLGGRGGRSAAWALASYVDVLDERRQQKALDQRRRTAGHLNDGRVKPLRQPGPTTVIDKQMPPSWWVDAPREGFSAVAREEEDDHMRSSRTHR